MLKIIKWSVTFCITVVLLIGETAQAMPPPKKKKRVTTPNKPITTRSVTIHQKAAASAYGNEPSIQERVVAKVDPLAQKLDYSDFNWGMLYPFYNESMSNVAFLKATQHEGYDNIPAIAQALSDSKDYPQATTAEIKFDIYLSLATLRGLCAKHRWYNLNGYKNVIKKIFNAGFRKTRIDYPKTEPVDMSKFHTELQYFIYDPGVQSIRLNNTALELVSVINEYVHPKNNDVDQKLALLGTQNFTFAQLLQYYPDEEEDIFVFLVSYPLETAKFEGPDRSIKYLRTETELKYKTAQFFNKLWDTSYNHEHLAKLANTAFKYNPLAYAAQTLKKNLTSPETRPVFTHSKSTEIPVSSTI
ncbi:MAG: hypothetical protein OXD32_07820 [Endozoicomonadaceae bacterium]|nr:hypothetical protein [Endozoicomonadaceae bacterium]